VSREAKKPKGFKPGSSKGRRSQYLSTKFKEAKEKGFVWLTHREPYGSTMYRLKVEPASDDNIPSYGSGVHWAFIRSKKGIILSEIHDYKGERLVAWAHGSTYRTICEDDILAVVTEKHAKKYECDECHRNVSAEQLEIISGKQTDGTEVDLSLCQRCRDEPGWHIER
jgi:hypothetical protein